MTKRKSNKPKKLAVKISKKTNNCFNSIKKTVAEAKEYLDTAEEEKTNLDLRAKWQSFKHTVSIPFVYISNLLNGLFI